MMDDEFVRMIELIQTVRIDDGVILVDGRTAVRVRGPVDRLGDAVGQLEEGVRLPSTDDVLTSLAERIDELGWLTRERKWMAEPRQARQTGYLTAFGTDAAHMQTRIGQASVAILGVGGIGSAVAQHLVGAGVRRLTLIDDDVVAVENFNRQFTYAEGDLGRPKVEALADWLVSFDPAVTVARLRRRVSRPADLADIPSCDLLFVAADEPAELADLAWDWCQANDTAFMRAAVGIEAGYWGPLLVPSKHCWDCFSSDRLQALTSLERLIEAALTSPTPWSFGPANTIISAWSAGEVVRFLGGHPGPAFGARMSLDFTDMNFRRDEAQCSCDRAVAL